MKAEQSAQLNSQATKHMHSANKSRFANFNLKELRRYIQANIQFNAMQIEAGIHESNDANSMANSEREQLRETNLGQVKDVFKINPVNISRKREKLHSQNQSRMQRRLNTNNRVLEAQTSHFHQMIEKVNCSNKSLKYARVKCQSDTSMLTEMTKPGQESDQFQVQV